MGGAPHIHCTNAEATTYEEADALHQRIAPYTVYILGCNASSSSSTQSRARQRGTTQQHAHARPRAQKWPHCGTGAVAPRTQETGKRQREHQRTQEGEEAGAAGGTGSIIGRSAWISSGLSPNTHKERACLGANAALVHRQCPYLMHV